MSSLENILVEVSIHQTLELIEEQKSKPRNSGTETLEKFEPCVQVGGKSLGMSRKPKLHQ